MKAESIEAEVDWAHQPVNWGVIRCQEPRLTAKATVAVLSNSLKIADFGLFDDITTAGGSLGVLNKDCWSCVQAQIDVAIMHKVKAIFVVDHYDCLAFKALGPFATEAEARDCHLAKLKEAKEKIKQYLSAQGANQIEVVAFYWSEQRLEPVE